MALQVYGFVDHCESAMLNGEIDGKEWSVIASTSNLRLTHGSILHTLAARALINDYEVRLHHADLLTTPTYLLRLPTYHAY